MLEDVHLFTDGKRVPTRTLFERIEPVLDALSRQFIVLKPERELTVGARYQVRATTADGQATLSSFVVADARDQRAPQIGEVNAEHFGIEQAAERGGGRAGRIVLDGAYDDHSDDDSLLLAVWDASKGTDAVPDEAIRVAQSWAGYDMGLIFRLSEGADRGCLPSNYAFLPSGTRQTLALALLDMAGNASAIRTIEVEAGKPPPTAKPVEPNRPMWAGSADHGSLGSCSARCWQSARSPRAGGGKHEARHEERARVRHHRRADGRRL
jgi:hypothetical protein